MASAFSFENEEVHVATKAKGISDTMLQDKDCDCCQHHGEYAVKENIKDSAAAGLKARYVLSVTSQTVFAYLIRSESIADIGNWNRNTSRVAFNKTPIYLSNRVLII